MNTDRNNRHSEAGQEADHPTRGTAATAKREASELARHHDPSVAPSAPGKAAQHSNQYGVAWVRPSELLAQAGSRVAGRGIDFHTELARRARRLPVDAAGVTQRAIGTRAHRLPPAFAFGTASASPRSAVRSSIGLR